MPYNTLVLKPVTDLLQYHFIVPDYQRGYRWTPTQVRALLDDIWKFKLDNENSSKDVFYCLQPIVVAKSPSGWIVIDGQQRLTTILLILTFLKELIAAVGKSRFTMEYQTRPSSQEYLKNLDLSHRDDSIDHFYIADAFEEIENWFLSQDGNARLGMIQTLLNDERSGKNVKVIWFEVGEGESSHHVDIFTRLNIGKIPLTNAELIKAMFLIQTNFPKERATLKQIQIASEWDQIEQKLQHNDFWYFIYDTENPIAYDNRIEYIFDMKYDRTRNDQHYHTFFKFVEEAETYVDGEKEIAIDEQWLEVKRYFLVFEEWFNTPEFYHLVGFLICCGVDVKTLKRESNGRTKRGFREYLCGRVRDQVSYDIGDLEYGDKMANARLRKVLLLFNIQTLRVNNNAGARFPFDQYKIERWDIEHIHSQTEQGIDKRYRKAWIDDVFNYFTGVVVGDIFQVDELSVQDIIADLVSRSPEVIEMCIQLHALYQHEIPNEDDFEILRRQVNSYFKEAEVTRDIGEYVNSIGNLALLDEQTNRSYKNALFSVKRKRIIDNDKVGKFVPVCTKNVFLKYYSKKFGQVMYWTYDDADYYTQAIRAVLKDFLPDDEGKTSKMKIDL